MSQLQVFPVFLLLFLTACATTGTHNVHKSKSTKASQINTDLGAAYLGQADYRRANAKLEKALQQDPDNAQAHNMYALLNTRLKQYAKAENSFSQALELEPNNPHILNNYGAFLCERGNIEAALQNFSAALKDPLYETPEYAYTNTGICMLKQKKVYKAESYFKAALKSNPKYAPVVYQMSLINEKKGQYALAWNYLERYYKLGATKNANNLWTAVRLSRYMKNRKNEAKYSSLLKNRYPNSAETELMMKRYR